MKVKVFGDYVHFGGLQLPRIEWWALCACGKPSPYQESWAEAMEWAWGHLVFTHQGESHRPPDWVDPWAEDNRISF